MESQCIVWVCGVLVSKKKLARHLQSHGEATFRCDICDSYFKTKDSLNQHSKTHRKPEEIECNFCQRVLFSRSALRKHILTKHETVEYSCPYCLKAFTKKDYCKNHVDQCRSSIPVKCSECDKVQSTYNRETRYWQMLEAYENKVYATKWDIETLYLWSMSKIILKSGRQKIHKRTHTFNLWSMSQNYFNKLVTLRST